MRLKTQLLKPLKQKIMKSKILFTKFFICFCFILLSIFAKDNRYHSTLLLGVFTIYYVINLIATLYLFIKRKRINKFILLILACILIYYLIQKTSDLSYIIGAIIMLLIFFHEILFTKKYNLFKMS